MRNLAEKQRRNKLNTCINELSQLVPLISNASKKIEKTSVLRLSAAYLRLSRRKSLQIKLAQWLHAFIYMFHKTNDCFPLSSLDGTQRTTRSSACVHKQN